MLLVVRELSKLLCKIKTPFSVTIFNKPLPLDRKVGNPTLRFVDRRRFPIVTLVGYVAGTGGGCQVLAMACNTPDADRISARHTAGVSQI